MDGRTDGRMRGLARAQNARSECTHLLMFGSACASSNLRATSSCPKMLAARSAVCATADGLGAAPRSSR